MVEVGVICTQDTITVSIVANPQKKIKAMIKVQPRNWLKIKWKNPIEII